MRCISPYSKYSIQLVEAEEQILVNERGMATRVLHQKPVIAQFETTGLLDHEVDVALTMFNFSALADGVNPLTRVGVYDTESIMDEDVRRHAEKKLIAEAKNTTDFIIVDMPRAEPPWPSYDATDLEEIFYLAETAGIDPERVYLYESENERRPEILEHFLKLASGDPEITVDTVQRGRIEVLG